MSIERAVRYQDYSVAYLVDETLREGVERTAFPITVDAKVSILKKMAEAGLRDFVVGCGPEEPLVWDRLYEAREANEIPANTKATFIVLLNCWETAFQYFKAREEHVDWIADTVFSFGMITYKQSELEFDRAIAAFRSIGATKFKASVLNNFRKGISKPRYQEICRQIDWSVKLDVSIIRINDSVGSLQPHVTQWLCSNLVKDYPKLVFCVHAHNDVVGRLKVDMNASMSELESNYKKVMSDVMGFYRKSTYTPQQLAQYAELVLSQESSTHG